MAADSLNTAQSSSQTTTQSPQAASASSFGASQASSGVQPGTPIDLLRTQVGIKLSNTALSSVNLSQTSGSTASQKFTSASAPSPRHINTGLLIFAVLLIVLAGAMFWFSSRPVKSTT